jgi:large subunit ribosomal protein L6
MESIELPDGISADISGNEIAIKGSLGTNRRRFNDALLTVSKSGNSINVEATKEKAIMKKAMNAEKSLASEIKRDVDGVQKHFEVKMEVVFAHFPITVEAKGSTVTIKNIFGERVPRTANIVGDTKVEVKDKAVRVYGTCLEDVKQTSANIRIACKIRKKDIRIFQDGVYYSITE